MRGQLDFRKVGREPEGTLDSSPIPSPTPQIFSGDAHTLTNLLGEQEQFALSHQAYSCVGPKRLRDLWKDPRKGVLGTFVDEFSSSVDLNPYE